MYEISGEKDPSLNTQNTIKKTDSQSFFQKHSLMLSFLGALIVFLTFITKEQLGDRWKSTSEAIETAQYMYDIQSEVTAQQDLVRELRIDLDSRVGIDETIQNVLGESPSSDNEDENVKRARAKADRIQYDAIVILSSEIQIMTMLAAQAKELRILLDKLPPDEATNNRIDKYLEDLNLDVGLMKMFAQRLKNNPSLAAKVFGGTPEVQKYQQEESELAKVVLSRAKSVRDRNSIYAKYANWFSTTLYVLGWGLGLAGRMQGASVDSIGDS